MKRAFPIEVIASATTGILLCDFSDLHQFFTYMVGGPIFNISLPRAAPQVAKCCYRQYPELKSIRLDTMKPKDVPAAVAALKAQFPNPLEMEPC